ncbi:MAG TPA: DUF167 domain-containing protein [Patescibacteria group bacterium]|nr:DUF167 domain-containing protein [Patescibacteria group bacterium]
MNLKSRSSRDEVIALDETTFEVHTKAPPDKGRAAKEGLKLLAHHLRLPVSKLSLTRGERFEAKTVIIE